MKYGSDHGNYGKHKGTTNGNWSGGKYVDQRGYVLILSPNHYHKVARCYAYEHTLAYEEHYQCCVLPWGHVHHKDGNKSNNDWHNLELLGNSKHVTKHVRLDKSNRQCSFCGSKETIIETLKTGYRTAHWYGDGKGGHLCNKCHCSAYYFKHKK